MLLGSRQKIPMIQRTVVTQSDVFHKVLKQEAVFQCHIRKLVYNPWAFLLAYALSNPPGIAINATAENLSSYLQLNSSILVPFTHPHP